MFIQKLIQQSLIFGIILSSLVFWGCPDDNPTIPEPGLFELNFRTTVSGQSFDKEVVYENIQGRKYYLDRFDLYISNIILIDGEGNEELLSDVELFDMTEPGANKTDHGDGVFKAFQVDAGTYKGVRFSIGVPDSLNLLDPATYGENHPLSTFNNMHWSWAAGYRFMVLEGKIDSSLTADGSAIAKPLVYHTGLNSLYRTVEYALPEHSFIIGEKEELQFIIEIDLNRFFYTQTDTLDMVDQNITHTMPEGSEEYQIAKTITDNMVNTALYKVPF